MKKSSRRQAGRAHQEREGDPLGGQPPVHRTVRRAPPRARHRAPARAPAPAPRRPGRPGPRPPARPPAARSFIAFQDERNLYIARYIIGGELFTHLPKANEFGRPHAVLRGADRDGAPVPRNDSVAPRPEARTCCSTSSARDHRLRLRQKVEDRTWTLCGTGTGAPRSSEQGPRQVGRLVGARHPREDAAGYPPFYDEIRSASTRRSSPGARFATSRARARLAASSSPPTAPSASVRARPCLSPRLPPHPTPPRLHLPHPHPPASQVLEERAEDIRSTSGTAASNLGGAVQQADGRVHRARVPLRRRHLAVRHLRRPGRGAAPARRHGALRPVLRAL